MLSRGLFPFKCVKGMYTCVICPYKTETIDNLKDHFSEHSEKYISISYKKYMKQVKFVCDNINFRCKVCSTEVKNFSEMKQHFDECANKKWFGSGQLPFKLDKDQVDCPVCNKHFLNFVSLNTHMNVHYPHHICESCGKGFASKQRLRAHIRTHEIGEFPCKICGLVFEKITKRENHVSKRHKSGVRYSCKKCSSTFNSFYARQKHLADEHNEDLKKYKCKACTQCYVTPGHLSSHVRRDHLNERNYKCEKCDLAFYTKNSLKMHMISHDGERIHSCGICMKSYQRIKTLREHMRIHNNDKRFVCPFCGRAFTQKCTLKSHLKLHDSKLDMESKVAPPLHSVWSVCPKKFCSSEIHLESPYYKKQRENNYSIVSWGVMGMWVKWRHFTPPFRESPLSLPNQIL